MTSVFDQRSKPADLDVAAVLAQERLVARPVAEAHPREQLQRCHQRRRRIRRTLRRWPTREGARRKSTDPLTPVRW